MINAAQITLKDLRVLVKDSRALMVLLAMPLVFIAILGFSTGKLMGWRSRNEVLTIALVSPAQGNAGASTGNTLVEEVVEGLCNRPGMDVQHVATEQLAHQQLDDGSCIAAVVIGRAFERRAEELTLGDVFESKQGKLRRGLEALDVHVTARSAPTPTRIIVEELVFAELIRTLLPHIARRDPLARVYLDRASAPAADEAGETAAGEQAAETNAAGTGDTVYQVIVPAYTVMFTFFLITIMARSFITERELGTLRRLQLAPVSPGAIVTGKTVPFLIVSVAQGALLFFFGRVLFGMSWGTDPWMLVLVIAATSLAATTLGLLTATLVRTDTQVSAYANLVVVSLAGLSGCFMPRSWLPEPMQQISLLTPHAWSLIAYDQLLNSTTPNLALVVRCCAMLLLFSVAFFVFGWRRFARFC